MERVDKRKPDELRPVSIETDYTEYAGGSVLICCGKTRVLCTAMVEDKVPLNIVQGILGHSSIETTRKYLHKNEDIEREAIGMMSDYLNMGQMDAAPRLNGTAPRAKFADVVLPTFPQRRNHTA